MGLKGEEAELPQAALSAPHDVRTAVVVLEGGTEAQTAAMTLLECCDPPTLAAALALLAERGSLTVAAFDCVADAWETYRHVKHHSWD